MPEPRLSRLDIVADLTIEVGDDRGSTTATLTNDAEGLVLEVPDPATLLRAVPGRGLRRDLPVDLPLERFADVPLRLRSRGRDIGSVRVVSGGGVRLRPAWSGVPTVVRTAASYGGGRALAVGLAAGAVVAVLVVLRRRR